MARMALRPALRAYAHAPAGAVGHENTLSLVFDGFDEYASSSTDVFNSAGAYTASAWVKMTDETVGTQSIFSVTVSGWPAGWHEGRFKLQFSNRTWTTPVVIGVIAYETTTDAGAETNSGIIFPATPWAEGEWHHIAMTSTGDGDAATPCKLYLDGALATSWTGVTWSATAPASTIYFLVGVGRNNYHKFNGNIDECAMWTRELPATGDESIESLFEDGPTDLSVTHSTSLRNWWRMGDPSFDGTTVEDVVGTSDLTASNMVSGNAVEDVPS